MYFYGRRCIMLRIFILGQCIALRIKNWHQLKETLSETVTVSDNCMQCRQCLQYGISV